MHRSFKNLKNAITFIISRKERLKYLDNLNKEEDSASVLLGVEIVALVCIGIVAGFAPLFNKDWAKPLWITEGAIFILFTIIDIIMLPKIWAR